MRGKSLLRPSLLRRSFDFRCFSSSSSYHPYQNHPGSGARRDSSRNERRSPNYQSYYNQENPTLCTPQFTFVPKSLGEPPKFSFEMDNEEPPVPPNVVLVYSDAEFETALGKAEGESQQTIFYFTAEWCAPCRFIGPILVELARRNHNVITYKLDIEEAALANTVKKLNITTVPTVHFFIEGKKNDEVVGPDAARIVQTMKKLYGFVEVKKDDGQKEENEKVDDEDDDGLEGITEKVDADDGREERTEKLGA